jgi:two-component system sensor histidine kinase KdpD
MPIETRPNPEALLKIAEGERRGRLKIFFGAAPGVGKTYEMVLAAHEQARRGVDVVIGVVETHGRKDTAALLIGLEKIPRKKVPYKGHVLEEMDLDAILARRPKLVLVDELAHTNAPGSRHPKRYQDVEELLAAGIDVYTTMNVIHVESLNDIVARITKARIQETVPDYIVDEADEIEIIDLAPTELIRRLKDGKVYIPEQIQPALDHFFSEGNLTALRELALRVTAEGVSRQMLAYMQTHGIQGPSPAGERLLVCLNEYPEPKVLVRVAKRRAELMRCPWTALYVETPSYIGHLLKEQQDAEYALRLAEKLGGETALLPGRKIVETLLDYCRRYNFTQVIVGKPWYPWQFPLMRTFAEKLIASAEDISIFVITIPKIKFISRRLKAPKIEVIPLKAFARSFLGMSLATALTLGLHAIVKVGPVAQILLFLPTLWSALYDGFFAGILGAFLAVMVLNFFFIPPYFTLLVDEPKTMVTLAVSGLTLVIVAYIGDTARQAIQLSKERALLMTELYTFSKKLAAAVTITQLLDLALRQISDMLAARAVFITKEGGRLVVKAGFPHPHQIGSQELAAAAWSYAKGLPAGKGSETLPGIPWLFLPLKSQEETIALVGIMLNDPNRTLTHDEYLLFDALTDLMTIALERIRLFSEAEKEKIYARTYGE